MNWDGIRYIFQIPLKWFEAIHKRVFNAYGTNFLTVREGYYGGTEIGIDTQGFSDAVALLGYGKVKTVDGNEPDENGNVELSDVVKSVNGELPDENGDVDLGDIVHTVNGTAPDANGNVQISIPQQSVRSVDHKSADQQGNIQLNAICTINGHNGDSVGNFAGVATSVNSISPDANGDVDLGDIVHSVNGTAPDANGDVDLDFVETVDGHSPDANGAVSFGLSASKWVKTDASGHLTTSSDNVVTIGSSQSGRSGNMTVVTDVTWNGTQLVVSKLQLTFTNGVVTGAQSQTSGKIDTVAYTP